MYTPHHTRVDLSRDDLETYRRRTALFGLISWKERVSTTTVGNVLEVTSAVPIDRIAVTHDGKTTVYESSKSNQCKYEKVC